LQVCTPFGVFRGRPYKTPYKISVILVFILGCLSGSLGTFVFVAHRTTVLLHRGAPAFAELVERRMTRHLDLDAAQKEKIQQFLVQNIDSRKQLQGQIQPDVQRLNFQTIQQIRSILRPDQARIFYDNLADYRKHLARAALPPGAANQPVPEIPADGFTDPPPAPPAGH